MLQMVRKLEDMPKRLPNKTKIAMVKAINGPETYHGHGCKIYSIIS
ncbi:Hypothetical protein I595_1853 [Croceitalea dokdonensis DOKDO 023]|uniref:Uncharacterized protein n=1 Tax=Croceitalea dokdonensis DOKDO 023 TaxID=1300341 RepID=A0A0P7B244_9FLAO|nr:Hypothetical protein I595_1853 [Croceitalea dokdonensis DOKDO 023]